MLSEDEEYIKRTEELNKILADPIKAKKIEGYLQKISNITKCDVEVAFTISPYIDDYMDHQESQEFTIPTAPTMKLGDVIRSLSKENDDYNVYVDPLYMGKGVNEIVDILITTKDDKLIIVPISNKKIIKL